MPTIFDRILSGEIPCFKLYEDEHVLSFLDVRPISRGHALVIPKERKAFLHELSDAAGAALGRALPRIAKALVAATGSEHYNVLQNNGAEAHQSVFHVHFHIIPRIGPAGLGIEWNDRQLEDGEALAQSIRDQLEATCNQPPYTL